MPAPTALVKAPGPAPESTSTATSIDDVAIPDADDELVMDPNTDLNVAQDSQMDGAPDESNIATFDEEGRPKFVPIKNAVSYGEGGDTPIPTGKNGQQLMPRCLQENLPHRESRTIPIPPHRFTPLRQSWPKLYSPLVEHLKLQVRVNVKRKAVDLRTSKATNDSSALQKGSVSTVSSFSFFFGLVLGCQGHSANRIQRRLHPSVCSWLPG